jgi:serine/threonine protein kinase
MTLDQIAGELQRYTREKILIKIADLGISRWMRPKGADIPLTMGRGTQQWSTNPSPFQFSSHPETNLQSVSLVAPEIMEGRKDYSFPVDVYSFGIILWELMTREEPYEEVRSP